MPTSKILVAPSAGAWIETNRGERLLKITLVAPSAGAWIETSCLMEYWQSMMSHPLRVRGLKLSHDRMMRIKVKVAPSAGAWIETLSLNTSNKGSAVAPSAGAWIETRRKVRALKPWMCRTLCGCVD